MPNTRCALCALLLAGAFLLGACKPESVVDADVPFATDDGALANWALPHVVGEPQILAVPTYDASGQSVHPDVVLFPSGWNGAHYWVSMTPYPNSASPYENPSILESNDGLSLDVPTGVINPLVPGLQSTGYNSDPDLVYDSAQNELVMSYRVVADGYNTIKIITTHDGTHWSDPRVAFREPNHSVVSQSIVPAFGPVPALAWYVDAGSVGCNATSSRVMMRYAAAAPASLAVAQWSNGRATDLRIPGYIPWHLKVSYIPSKREYWALVAAYPDDGRGCGADDLFLAHSKNGVHWETFAQPLMRHQEHWWSAGALYRGTFLYDSQSDQLAVWFSARDADYVWRMLFVRMDYTALAARLARPGAALATGVDSASRSTGRPRERWTTAP
jgi:predicted GH43/DUF377 family glycosyl hydrolase